MRKSYFGIAFMSLLMASCSKEQINVSSSNESRPVNSIEIGIPNDGSMGLYSRAGTATQVKGENGRWLNSSEASHSIDCVKIIIMDNTDLAKSFIAADTLITDWMTSDKVEDYSSEVSGHGRRFTFPLTGSNAIEWEQDNGKDRRYTIYAFGYSSKSQMKMNGKNFHEYMKSLGNGKKWENGNVVDNNEETEKKFSLGYPIIFEDNSVVKEIFSGSSPLNHGATSLFLNRMVAGIYSYLKDIPYAVDSQSNQPGNCLSLVISENNRQIPLMLFTQQQPVDNNTMLSYVVNGYDSKGRDLAGGKILYDIELDKWFNQIKDENNDGNIDVLAYKNNNGSIVVDNDGEKNWKKSDEERFSDSRIKEGAVFGGDFVLPFDHLAGKNFSIKLVLTRKEKEIRGFKYSKPIREWTITLPKSKVEKMNNANVWYLYDESRKMFVPHMKNDNRTSITSEKYSVVRNQLYSIGTKPKNESDTEDKPISLQKDVISASVNDAWYDTNDMEIK